MNINKFEAIGIAVSVGAMALALVLLRLETSFSDATNSLNEAAQPAAAIVVQNDDISQGFSDALDADLAEDGKINRLIIDDVVIGSGPEVSEGDTISVHYAGILQNGQQFDNSYTKGKPLTFTVGEGRVISGWERGVIGMQVGGERVLVIPPEYAYGETGAGPIPPDATLIFTIELLDIF